MMFVLILTPNLADARKKNVIRAPGGINIPQPGLLIDASYDPRLDSFLSGYKIINAVLSNQSFDIVALDPESDKWSIKLVGEKREIRVISDLRSEDPKAWGMLPEKVKTMIAYPLALPIGGSEVIDLFVPASVDVEKFNELIIYIRSLDTKFEILVRQ